jgi:hypothetical protein
MPPSVRPVSADDTIRVSREELLEYCAEIEVLRQTRTIGDKAEAKRYHARFIDAMAESESALVAAAPAPAAQGPSAWTCRHGKAYGFDEHCICEQSRKREFTPQTAGDGYCPKGWDGPQHWPSLECNCAEAPQEPEIRTMELRPEDRLVKSYDLLRCGNPECDCRVTGSLCGCDVIRPRKREFTPLEAEIIRQVIAICAERWLEEDHGMRVLRAMLAEAESPS